MYRADLLSAQKIKNKADLLYKPVCKLPIL